MEIIKLSIPAIFSQLQCATVDKKHPFNKFALGTVYNNFPELRTVVLRAFCENTPSIFFHTDFRSPKINQIQVNQNISCLFYDYQNEIQLCVKAQAIIHHDNDAAFNFWQSSSPNSLKLYCSPTFVNTTCLEHTPILPPPLQGNVQDLAQVQQGYVNFALVECQIQSINALLLQRSGNISCEFSFF